MELELADTDLFEIVLINPLKESQARVVTKQLCNALFYLHNEIGLIHRDLKCENVLVFYARSTSEEDDMEIEFVKICDFGLCTLLRNDPAQTPW